VRRGVAMLIPFDGWPTVRPTDRRLSGGYASLGGRINKVKSRRGDGRRRLKLLSWMAPLAVAHLGT